MAEQGITYFGLNFRPSPRGYHLTRENYVTVTKKSSFRHIKEEYTDECCAKQKERALINFDINMERYSKLSENEFNEALANFLNRNKQFKEIKDLNDCLGVKGYYILVLDRYKQAYIGTSGDIATRVRSHWTKTKQFDRLIFGNVENSTLSIDSFMHLDTTRIFVYPTDNIYLEEDRYVKDFDHRFLLNRVGGGEVGEGIERFVAHEQRTRELEQKPNTPPKDVYVKKDMQRERVKNVTIAPEKESIFVNKKYYVTYKYLESHYGINYARAKNLIYRYGIETIRSSRLFIERDALLSKLEYEREKTRSVIVGTLIVLGVLLFFIFIIVWFSLR